MNTKIYFNPLPDSVTENELTELFSAYGNLVNVHIATNRAGSVTMITPEGARTAIQSLNGKVLSSGTLNLTTSPSGPRRRASYLY
jgi:RNA recognition motif-containing protein